MWYIPNKLACLKLSRSELPIGAFYEFHHKKAVLHFDRFILWPRKPMRGMAPEIRTITPLCVVKRIPIKLVIPY